MYSSVGVGGLYFQTASLGKHNITIFLVLNKLVIVCVDCVCSFTLAVITLSLHEHEGAVEKMPSASRHICLVTYARALLIIPYSHD